MGKPRLQPPPLPPPPSGRRHPYDTVLAAAKEAAARAASAQLPPEEVSPLKEVVYGVRAISPLLAALALLVVVVLRQPLPNKSFLLDHDGGGGLAGDGSVGGEGEGARAGAAEAGKGGLAAAAEAAAGLEPTAKLSVTRAKVRLAGVAARPPHVPLVALSLHRACLACLAYYAPARRLQLSMCATTARDHPSSPDSLPPIPHPPATHTRPPPSPTPLSRTLQSRSAERPIHPPLLKFASGPFAPPPTRPPRSPSAAPWSARCRRSRAARRL
jgi:hypothetical protein